MRAFALACSLLLIPAASSRAQTVTIVESNGSRASAVAAGPGAPALGIAAQWMPFELNAEPGGVKGAPYSATAVTETTQVLGDGNRISRRSEAAIHRDAEGRTRREHSVVGFGPVDVTPDAREMITIDDPVKGEHYILDAGKRIARRMKVFTRFAVPPPGPADGNARVERNVTVTRTDDVERQLVIAERKVATVEGAGTMAFTAQGGDFMTFSSAAAFAGPGQGQTESLGTMAIEGVQAEGTKTTIVIAAGQIGNERPIEIVSERWFSPELKTVVMSRHSDPRVGETVYRLTRLVRGDPDPSLFQVPADFTVQDVDGQREVVRIKRREP